jgi:hypothetical protein
VVPRRNAFRGLEDYAVGEPLGPVRVQAGGYSVQTTQPRDVAALALVVGLFLVLFIVTLMLGSPPQS